MTPDGGFSQALSPDERAFVAGSLLVELVPSRVQAAGRPVGLGAVIRTVRLLRRSEPVTLAEIGASPGLPTEPALNTILAKFDPNFRQTSRRLEVGTTLIAAPNLAGGFVRAAMTMLRQRSAAVRTGAPRRRTPRSSRLAALDGPPVLEAWDDLAEADDGTDQPAAHANSQTPTQRRQPALHAWVDEGDARPWLDDIGAEAPVEPRLATAADWLRGLGYAQSGIRIEPFIAKLVDGLSEADLDDVLIEMRGGRDLAAVEHVVRVHRKLAPGSGAGLHLAKLASVLRSTARGYVLRPRQPKPAYVTTPSRVFYLAHMRGPYEANGYVSRTRLILKSMIASGLEPIAVTRLGFPHDLARHRTASIAELEIIDGVATLALPDPANGLVGRPIDGYIDAYASRIVDLARTYRPAAIHGASNFMNGLAAIQASRILGIPAIYELRGIWEITQASSDASYEQTLRYRLHRTLEDEVAREADRVITISEPLRRFAIDHGAEAARVSVVPNGVDVAKFRPLPRDPALAERLGVKPDEVVIGYVGSILQYEGLDYLVGAANLLRHEGVGNFRCLIVGEGRELDTLKSLAAAKGVDDLFVFAGRVDHTEVEAYYSIIDIVALPRRSLPVTELVPPLKPFEAMAAGKAVIVSSVEAIAETVIDGETGLVVAKDNVAALASALRTMIENPSLGRQMGARARDWVQRERSVASLATQLAAVYASIGVPAAGVRND